MFQQPLLHWKRIEGVSCKLKWQICQATVKSHFYNPRWALIFVKALLGVRNRNSHPKAGLDTKQWGGSNHTEVLLKQLAASTRGASAVLRQGWLVSVSCPYEARDIGPSMSSNQNNRSCLLRAGYVSDTVLITLWVNSSFHPHDNLWSGDFYYAHFRNEKNKALRG